MSQLGLVLAGSSESRPSQSQVYLGLTYHPRDNLPYSAEISELELKVDSNPSNQYKFVWTHLKGQPAPMRLVNANRVPSGLEPAQLPLNSGGVWYMALESIQPSTSPGTAGSIKYYPLKYRQNQFIFVDENPTPDDTVRLVVPAGSSLRTNDVETRLYLKLGDQPLIDRIAVPLKCTHFYLSPYEWSTLYSAEPDPVWSEGTCSCSSSSSSS